jgi:hypothetical protein
MAGRGQRKIDVVVAGELPLDFEMGVAHAEVACGVVDPLGGVDSLPVLDEGKKGV